MNEQYLKMRSRRSKANPNSLRGHIRAALALKDGMTLKELMVTIEAFNNHGLIGEPVKKSRLLQALWKLENHNCHIVREEKNGEPVFRLNKRLTKKSFAV